METIRPPIDDIHRPYSKKEVYLTCAIERPCVDIALAKSQHTAQVEEMGDESDKAEIARVDIVIPTILSKYGIMRSYLHEREPIQVGEKKRTNGDLPTILRHNYPARKSLSRHAFPYHYINHTADNRAQIKTRGQIQESSVVTKQTTTCKRCEHGTESRSCKDNTCSRCDRMHFQ